MIVNLRIFHFLRPPGKFVDFRLLLSALWEDPYPSKRNEGRWDENRKLRWDSMMRLICWFFIVLPRRPWNAGIKAGGEMSSENKQSRRSERLSTNRLSFYYDGSWCCIIKPIPDVANYWQPFFSRRFSLGIPEKKWGKQKNTAMGTNNNAKFSV